MISNTNVVSFTNAYAKRITSLMKNYSLKLSLHSSDQLVNPTLQDHHTLSTNVTRPDTCDQNVSTYCIYLSEFLLPLGRAVYLLGFKIDTEISATHIQLVSQRICIPVAMCCKREGPYDILHNSDMTSQLKNIVPDP
jgi:hypothetical protein